MRVLVATILIALLSFTAGLYLPWWSFAPVAFLVAFFLYQKPVLAFVAGFAALLFLWGGLAYWIDRQNEHILSTRIAALFPLGGDPYLLILVTALVPAIIAGLAALSGNLLLRYLLLARSPKVKKFAQSLARK
jgi:hypothetical protein